MRRGRMKRRRCTALNDLWERLFKIKLTAIAAL